jgi:hypothetical protein
MKKMTKTLLSTIALIALYANTASGQDKLFELTPDGFVSSADPTMNYVVFEYDSISQADLFKSVLLFLHTAYKSPKDVVSEIPSEAITLRGSQLDAIGIPYRSNADRKVFGKYEVKYDIDYGFTIQFQDNKIRVDAPTFECSRVMNRGQKAYLTLTGKGGFLSDNHHVFNLKNGKVEDDVKNQIETFFNSLCSGVKLAPQEQGRNEEW